MLETSLTPRAKHSDSVQLNLFEKPFTHIQTEGIKYSGSKLKLLPYILSIIRSLPVNRILDGFSGTTRVSQALAKCNYQVIFKRFSCLVKNFWRMLFKRKTKSFVARKDRLSESLKRL